MTVGHADDLGLDPRWGEWYTVCVEHRTFVAHRTQMLARELASRPLLWCEACRS